MPATVIPHAPAGQNTVFPFPWHLAPLCATAGALAVPFADFQGSFGVIGPSSQGFRVSGVQFVDFAKPSVWSLGSCCRCERFAPGGGGFQFALRNVTWTNSTNKAYWRWQNEGILVDEDGSWLSNRRFVGFWDLCQAVDVVWLCFFIFELVRPSHYARYSQDIHRW
jgi:hypothetical protein